MWVLTTRGFFSVVQDREDPTRVLVRARVGADLDRLREILPHLETWRDDTADYRWRARARPAEWAYALGVMAGELDYHNFKDAVAERQGKRRARIYEDVWTTLRRLMRDDGGGG